LSSRRFLIEFGTDDIGREAEIPHTVRLFTHLTKHIGHDTGELEQHEPSKSSDRLGAERHTDREIKILMKRQ
jgi:hypothetical protein